MIYHSIPKPFVPVIAAIAIGSLHAEVKPNPIFSDGAVLQRGQPVPVWGSARDGEKVTVAFENQTLSTTATNGKWSVKLKPLNEGGPFTMTITGDNVVTVNDLLVGDVWLCSGQSNMHFQMKSVENAPQEIAALNYPRVRFFNVKHQFAQDRSIDTVGAWMPVTPATGAACSAVACYFGTALHRQHGIPVGLVISAVGGTRIESWMRAETLAATGESAALVKKWSDISPEEFKRIGAEYSAFQHQRDHVHPDSVREAKAQGQPAPPPPVQPKIRCHDCPSALHNAMIAPLQPFAIRGAIWYQGESNAGQPGPYQKLLPAMIGDWREVWGKELPFLFVQIAPHRSISPSFREAQHLIWQNTPRTAMVVTTDVGNAENIHPTRKRPVGERLALAARALSYGESLEYSGPIFKGMKVEGAHAVISFSHTGSGLVAKGDELKGFTIAGDDNKFIPARAKIDGSTVVLSSEKITKPAAARYAWATDPDGNLFNQEGLPAAPFRSDGPTALFPASKKK
jgi:sialate O-acetylesterase